MTEQALFDATFRRWEMLLGAWNFYLVVAAAVVGVFALVPAARNDRRSVRVAVAGFVFFAWTHLLGLLYILKQWAAIADELKRVTGSRPDAAALHERFANAGVVDAPDPVWVVPFHVAADVFVVLAVLWLARARPAV